MSARPLFRDGESAARRAAPGDTEVTTADLELELLLHAIAARHGYDFRGYSRVSLKRRLGRALADLGYATLSDLQGAILRDERVFLALLPWLTVSVTSMFRDPAFFAAFRAEVVPWLRTWASAKLWVAGASTGEEVLSFCIVLHEEGLLARTLVYATDINPASLDRARKGVYPLADIPRFTAAYHEAGGTRSFAEYYSADYDAALFDPRLLERVVFAEHSLATDAVFSEVQVVSCRNVLIYFDRALQDRAFGLFHGALCPGGHLCLGSKETLRFSRHADRFGAVVPEQRIYQKRR